MALVSGGRSTLNPNAPLFIPAAFRQVEDFSPEWWQLITTSAWFHNYWLSQHQDEDGFYDNGGDDGFDGSNVADLLPDTFDLDAGENFSSIEAQFDELVMSFESVLDNVSSPLPVNDADADADALMKNMSVLKSPKFSMEPAKYVEKPAKYVNPKCSPRRIQQPR